MNYTAQVDYHMKEENVKAIIDGLDDANTPFFGHVKSIDFGITLQDDEGIMIGGLIAWMRPGMGLLYIDTIWVAEHLRHHGYGAQLILAAEAEGRKHGCTHSQADTVSFQAEGFYKKLGYYRIGKVEKLFGEHDYLFMRKKLI